MPLNRGICCLIAGAMFLPAALGQLIAATVMAGANGSFFEPPTVSVTLNAIVRFAFVGTAHSVVQSSFDDPCSPLPGGFSSGTAGYNDSSIPAALWDLRVTNVSQPIWFYCANTLPRFHCSAGMVGAINPPSIEAYNQFVSAAEAVQTIPTSFPTDALSGIGASATAFPIIPSTSSSSTAESTPTSTPTSLPVTSSNKGAIIGGVVGGTVALVVAIALAWFLGFRHKRGSSKESIDHNSRSPQPFNSNASPNAYGTPTNAPTQSDRAPLAIQISRSNFTETTSTSMPSTGYPQGSDRTSRKLQVTNQTIARPPTSPSHTGRTRALPTTPPLDSPPMIEQQSSRTSHAQSASVSSQDRDPPSQDMNTLAREVAAVIMQNAAGGRSSGDEAPPSYAAHN